MKVTVGSAPDSWGVWFPSHPQQTPWKRFMDEIKEAGYEWTELGPYGYLPKDPKVLQNELSSRSLKTCGTFVMDDLSDPKVWRDRLEQETRKTCQLVAELGGKYIVLIGSIYSDLFTGEQIAPAKLTDEKWKQFIDTSHKVADIANKNGLAVVYHPHAETHIEYEDQIERYLQDTDPKRIGLCLDTGHHAYRGGDPVAFMRKHHRRIPYLHLKSVDGDIQKKVEREKIPFAKAVEIDMFCEPSKGAVDFIAFRDMLREINFEGMGIVEQDMFPCPPEKPMPIAKRTREYLRKIGIG